jgi:hypothetical protein
VIDEKPFANLDCRVDLDTSKHPGDVGGKPGKELQVPPPKPVGDTVEKEGVEPRIAENNIQRAPTRRIPFLDCPYVRSDVFKHDYNSLLVSLVV